MYRLSSYSYRSFFTLVWFSLPALCLCCHVLYTCNALVVTPCKVSTECLLSFPCPLPPAVETTVLPLTPTDPAFYTLSRPANCNGPSPLSHISTTLGRSFTARKKKHNGGLLSQTWIDSFVGAFYVYLLVFIIISNHEIRTCKRDIVMCVSCTRDAFRGSTVLGELEDY